MAIIKPEQLSSGYYTISGSFSGSFHGDGSDLTNIPQEILKYSSSVNFPQPSGSSNYLYLDQSANNLYSWDTTVSQYVLLNSATVPPPSGSPEGTLYFADLATTGLLATCVYNNGISGSGATLTSTGSIALGQTNQPGKIDNTVPSIDDIILVKNETSTLRNGLYSITNSGSPSSSFVLTRVSYYDTGSEMYPSQITVLRGLNNANQTFIQKTDNPTVGSSSIVFQQAPSTATQILPVLFMDTATTGPLPTYTYTTGSSYPGFPGYQATITATVTGSLGVIGGVTASSGTRILVVSESNKVYNGDYTVTAPGSSTTPWKLTRIGYWQGTLEPRTREWAISRYGATEYGSRYVLQSSSINPALIGISQALVFQKYLYPTSGSNSPTSAFPYTGSALITGSLGITGSLTTKSPGATSTDIAFRVTNALNTSSILSIAGNGAFTYNANTGSIIFIEGTAAGAGQKFIIQRQTYSASLSIGNNGGTTLTTDGLNVTSNNGAIELNGGPSNGGFYQSIDLKGNSNLSARVNSNGQFAFTSDTSWYNGANGFTYTNDKVIIDGHTMAFRSASIAPSTTLDTFKLYSADIVPGNAAPHFRTENGNIVKLYAQAPVTSSQGIADALTNLGLLTGSSTIFASSGGPIGIANTSGSYTYYTSFSASMAAATAGSTVELFADITETSSVSINLKNGVNINGNGHTYTLNTAGTASCIQDNGVAVSCSISNITFTRLGGTASSTNTLCMYITGASIIKAYGTKLIGGATNMRCLTINNSGAQVFGIYAEGYNPTITVTAGQLLNSTGKSIAGQGIFVDTNGTAIDCTGYGYNSAGIQSAGKLIKCVGVDPQLIGINSSAGIVQDCTGYGMGGAGIYINSLTTVAINSTGYSTGGSGVFTVSPFTLGVKGYSTAGFGIYATNGILTDCLGYSTTTNGIYMDNSGATISELRSCKAISTAASAISQNNLTSGCKIYNTEAISRWNTSGGHGIVVYGNNTEIAQCTIETTNTSANCISGSSALTVKYANNVFKGATVAITPNITQGMINTHDNQGNIII